ncbi:AfsR/SARP family transcriptional regulator [Actinoplanes sp. HUAS TT8]|uniref:AfsR/SARP family transcriptional regulator n=1 Tax=Actinoplanes sp. HUAS TT8 TaxID=3447453 RepID=UPI003F51C50F
MSPELTFSLLGPLEVRRDGQALPLGSRQHQLILALLLARAGEQVRGDELVELLWGDQPPVTALNVVHRAISRLRNLLEPERSPRSASRWLTGGVGGYTFIARPGALDLLEFRELAEEARDRAAEDEAGALKLFVEALSLWTGACAGGPAPGEPARPAFAAVDAEGSAVAREAAKLALRTGQAGLALPVLEPIAARHPWDEALQAPLLRLMAADGKQAAAVMLYGNLASRLSEELGVDPGAELRDAYRSVMSGSVDEPVGESRVAMAGPAQLPPDMPYFAGQQALIQQISGWTDHGREAMPTVVVDGMPGVGKTTLAVHIGHLVAPQFPDGQLFADMRGFHPYAEIADPAETLLSFLTALGLPAGSVPQGVESRSSLFRSVVADRRILIVLDNVRGVEQVRPLLPGSPGCMVVVTSRSRLPELVTAHGARTLSLGLPSMAESRAAMAERLGGLAWREPKALDEIVQRCGRLPLAMAIVGGRAAATPDSPLSVIAAELRTAGENLDAFDDGDLNRDVRAVFTWSYQLLSPAAARLFRLLSRLPAPVTTLHGAAALAGIEPAEAHAHLREMIRTRLVDRCQADRYRVHDLVSRFAGELCRAEDTVEDRAAAWGRLCDYYRQTAHLANERLTPQSPPGPVPAPPLPGVVPTPIETSAEATAWFTAELPVLRAVVERSTAGGAEAVAWPLALTTAVFLDRTCRWHEWLALMNTGLRAAAIAQDLHGVALTAHSLAGAHWRLGNLAEASWRFTFAEERFRRVADEDSAAHAKMNRGMVEISRGNRRAGVADLVRALRLLRHSDRRQLSASARSSLARCLLGLGLLTAANRLAAEALGLYRELGDMTGMTIGHHLLAEIDSAAARHESAIRRHERAVSYAKKCGAQVNLVMAYTALGDAYLVVGDTEAARRAWIEARSQVDDPTLEPVAAITARLQKISG